MYIPTIALRSDWNISVILEPTLLDLFFIAAKICQDVIDPLVASMDKDASMDPSVTQALFDNGVSRPLHSSCRSSLRL